MNATAPTQLAATIPFGARPAVRRLKDDLARWSIAAGGMGVIVAISLIFFYLLWVVLPLFQGASIEVRDGIQPQRVTAAAVWLGTDELGESALRVDQRGELLVFDLEDGHELQRTQPELLRGAALFVTDREAGTLAILDHDGGLRTVRVGFDVSYPEGVRTVTPVVEALRDGEVLPFVQPGSELVALSFTTQPNRAAAAALTADGRLLLRHYRTSRNFLSGESTTTAGELVELPMSRVLGGMPQQVLLEPSQRWLYVIGAGRALAYLQLDQAGEPLLLQTEQLVPSDRRITVASLLLGGYSLLIGDDAGGIQQWFPVRDEAGGFQLQRIRGFELDVAVVDIVSEHRRKGFVAAGEGGVIGLFHSTAERELLERQVSDGPIGELAISPRGRVLLTGDGEGRYRAVDVDNEHPEISWASLWGEVHYESFPGPAHIWQSSAANSDAEPKFSLTPLAFGTLKAALYAMLFAVPLAIFGAMYTAYFMRPSMRRMIKPTVEIMGALPTVIIGFLAGLWLAPVMEANLAGVFLALILLPLSMPAFGYLWTRAPRALRYAVPSGLDAALLIPVVCLVGWGSFALGGPVEQTFFGGSLPQWLSQEVGIGFDQRNAMVVGIAMGFAVIPTIFSIAEDALFGVPKHLSDGSLALGATRWQTLIRVVLPTASPGIFSAVMIGLGRAVGETMIVLMATGNTPIMDVNIFEGMRTLSANIAVEMPESEVGSTHYRILFLAGLVLFLFTFVFNTGAEVIRQRLRTKYANL